MQLSLLWLDKATNLIQTLWVSHSLICVYIFSSMKFYHMCKFLPTSPQSRYRTVCSVIERIPHNTLLYAIVIIILSFQECYINKIIQYDIFWDWLFLLSIIPLIHLSTCVFIVCHFYCWVVFHVVDISQSFNHLPVKGH